MTLYWYMHWFWITYYAALANVTNPTPIYEDSGSRNYSLEEGESAKKPLLINNTEEVNESVIELETNNNSTPLSNLTVNPSNHSDINVTSYYEASCNNHSELILNSSEQRNANNSQVLDNLSAAGITGITLSCVFVVGVVMILSYIIYKNRGFNRPQVLNDHCSNLDSSGYIDDTSDNSEEMYSLDNDSFLNSLEAMTIQNYWTDTVKHTKL